MDKDQCNLILSNISRNNGNYISYEEQVGDLQPADLLLLHQYAWATEPFSTAAHYLSASVNNLFN